MGKTITEKILAKAAGRKEVSPGEYIEVGSRCPTPMGNFGGLRGGSDCRWSPRRDGFAQCGEIAHGRA